MEKDKYASSRFSAVTKDLCMIIISVITVLIFSYFFNIFYFLIVLFKNHPKAITWIDEIISGLLALSVSLAVFAWRRWLDLKQETAERIKRQEELIKVSETRAEVERIIGKQARSDIDEIKHELQEIRHLLLGRRK